MILKCLKPILPIIILLLKPYKFAYDYILVLASVLFLYYLVVIFHPEYISKIDSEMWNVVINSYTGIVGYLYIRFLVDKKQIKNALLFAGSLLFIAFAIQGYQALQRGYWVEVVDGVTYNKPYSMSFGYNMLFPALCFLFYGFWEKKKLLTALGIIGSIMILILGSRAAFFCIIFFIVLYLALFTLKNANANSRSLILFSLIFFGIIFAVFYIPILETIASVFRAIGFPSRTIERIIQGSLTEDIARDTLYEKTIDLIKEKPFFGHGFLADRYYLGVYCHNLFLELFLQFGIICGGIFSVVIIYITLKMFFKCRDDEWKGIFLIFFSATFIRLMVSYSLWDDKNFWMMIGVYVTYSTIAKAEKKKNANLITSTLGKT